MTDEAGFGQIHIDSDWKSEAAREKEKLAQQERAAAPSPGGETFPGAAGAFAELVNLIAMQAVVSMGGLQGPGGERIPANPAAAKHFIDILEMLQQKTRGNLSDDEQRLVEVVLYELRMSFVQAFSAPPPGPAEEKAKPSP